MPTLEPIQAQLEALAADSLSGASAISQRGADILRRLAEQSRAGEMSDLRAELIDAARALVRAQPAMVPLLNMANSVLWAIEPLDDTARARSTVASACTDFIARVQDAQSHIAHLALHTIPTQKMRILTHSYSSTVMAALIRAFQEGRLEPVVCTESGPQMEGKLLASRLAAEGVEARSIVDRSAPRMVAQVDAVWVGADGLTEVGLINKVGTLALASAAQPQGIPLYTLCSTDKIAPQGYHTPLEPDLASPQRDFGADLFDLTPLHLISGAVTEKGILRPQAILDYVRRHRLHPSLR